MESAPIPGPRVSRYQKIREQRSVVTFRVFKEQGRAAAAESAIGDFGHLKIRIYLFFDSHQVAVGFQGVKEFAEVPKFHTMILYQTDSASMPHLGFKRASTSRY